MAKKQVKKTTSRSQAPGRPPARKTSHVATLASAGVLHPDRCSEAHKAAIEKLSPAEVKALVSVRKKLATHVDPPGPGKTEGAGRPWML